MKEWQWALLTVVLYAVILATLLLPLMWAAFWPESFEGLREEPGIYMYVGAGGVIWVLVMAMAETALLVVPVRIARGRPARKRWLVFPLLASLFMLAVMVAAMYLGVWEHLENTEYLDGSYWTLAFWGIGILWGVWALLFGLFSFRRDPRTFMGRAVKFLLAGSILELLVAIPTHVIARQRNYCCAGFGTFWGLVSGVSVMLFAFGPAVFFLFVRRWPSIRPPRRPKD